MSENRLKYQCACGYEIAGPVSQMMPLLAAHNNDPACPFAEKGSAS